MIEPGTLLQNRYRVTRQIGCGGMGAVYVATDERFNSTVAIKQTFFDEPALRRAFEREAVLLNHLRHTALPRVSDHFVEEEGQFLVMEYIEGADLGELLKERGGWFPLTDVMSWADELLDALEYLHTQEPPVVHRDIKPQNIKRTKQGRMVLLDFGLAKGTPTRPNLTATGSVLGYSPHYAPLEQVQGNGTDPRSDIYSLGATLYHLLTGEPPVDALSRAAAVVNNEADPLRPAHVVRPHIPVSVSRVLRRALAQKAALRPQTVAEMRELLRQAAANGDATVVDSQLVTHGAGLSLHFGETTIDALRLGARTSERARFSSHFNAEPERRSFGATTKLLVVAAVVAICAAVAFPLLGTKSTDGSTPAAVAASPTPSAESAADEETEAPEAKTSDEADASPAAAATPSPSPTDSTDAPEAQTDSGTSNADENSKQATPAQNLNPIVIVVNPTPTPISEEEAARRAAEERRRQRTEEEYRRLQEEERRRQQAQPPYGAPPPPPPGGYPPPPGGHPFPPPPHRPPPY